MAIAWKRDLKIYLYWGDKGSGKGYFLFYVASHLIKQYFKNEKKFPNLPKRKLYSSMKFASEFEKIHLYDVKLNPGGHLHYWTNPRQLYGIRNADILWDEIGKDLPSGSWADTPKKLKQVFSHLRKRGNRIFANTQIYEDIDIAFRRQIDYAYRLEKHFGSVDISATLPAPRFIWGLISVKQFDPKVVEIIRNEEEREEYISHARYYVIRKKYVKLYDTTMELPPYLPDKLEHITYTCDDCGAEKVEHKKL